MKLKKHITVFACFDSLNIFLSYFSFYQSCENMHMSKEENLLKIPVKEWFALNV